MKSSRLAVGLLIGAGAGASVRGVGPKVGADISAGGDPDIRMDHRGCQDLLVVAFNSTA
jgi:hypothetical protein